MAGCMATLRPLVSLAWTKAQSLRSSRSTDARKSQPVEIGMSSNKNSGVSKRADVIQLSKDSGSTSEVQCRHIDLTRISPSTSHKSTECSLLRAEEQHALQ